jgi:hypothetical protein
MGCNQRFERTYCLHLQVRSKQQASNKNQAAAYSMFLRTVDDVVEDYAASYPRRHYCILDSRRRDNFKCNFSHKI